MPIGAFQTAVSLIYPPRCLSCGHVVESEFGLCGACWAQTPFIGGAICDLCGVPLPGQSGGDALSCDGCMTTVRPWRQGRAALIYGGHARKLVLALKHGDRQEIARPAALWMAQAVHDLPLKEALVVPVPLHWLRFLSRRYNQSALLAQALGAHMGLDVCPDLLVRARRTASLDGLGREARFRMLEGAIDANPRRAGRLAGRPVLLVDDVMTSGATLSAAAKACIDAGLGPVFVVTLARVAKET